ncbi:peptidase [Brevibacillus ruminantium]|uniref:Peptidase n=1 Tax=Brevibacillus ruminantium TaxID=2950604 RepID=A0ABY4WGP9_9BACL|nr:peptidase [Brevibacillus ruminantium]USG65020.1 peptidase [Brevibacillus ruminantium]
MDVDKELREAVQNSSRKVVQDVTFTPELEKRIYDQLATRRKKSSRIYMFGTIAACLALALGVWTGMPAEFKEGWQQSASILSEQKAKAMVQKALQPLQTAIPELSSYQLEIKDTASGTIQAVLRKSDREFAKVAINRTSQDVEVFKWTTGETDLQAPSEEMAKEKATAFLRTFLGEKSEQYRQVAAREIYRPQNGYLELDVNGMYVAFKQTGNGKGATSSDLSVWVDGSGRIVSYGYINQDEQALLAKLEKALPEWKADYVLANKDASSSGHALTLAGADKKGHTALVSVGRDGHTLLSYQVGRMGDQVDPPEWAPKSLALEKANQFLQQILEKDWKNYRETGNTDIPRYRRYHDGLPVLEDHLYVAVDREGRVLGYGKSVDQIDLARLPDPSKALPLQDAKQAVAENMKLRYIENVVFKRDPVTREPVEAGPLLEYTPAVAYLQMGDTRSLYWYIDAETGKIRYGLGNNGMEYDQLSTHEPIRMGTGKPDQPAVKTKEEAARLLTDEWGVHLQGLKLHEYDREDGRKQKVYKWETKDQKRLEVVTDGQTGRVIQVEIPRTDTQITVSQQDAFQEAIRVLKTYTDPGVEEVQLSQVIEPGQSTPVSSGDWQFEFIKSHEGVPVLEQNANEAYIVTVDPSTGKANGFLNRTDMTAAVALPDKKRAISVEQAAQAYLNIMPLQLAYTLKGVEGEKLVEPKLIYVPMNEEYAERIIHLDAITGKAVIR